MLSEEVFVLYVKEERMKELKDFVKAKGEMFYRSGTKANWIEVEVRQKDGKSVKLIAREVKEFWSERETKL